MEAIFSVTAACNNKITITGQTIYDSLAYDYDNSITINVITLESVNTAKFIHSTYSTHSVALDEVQVSLPIDGVYTVTQLIVPTYEWCKANLNKKKINYASDGKSLYQVAEGQIKTVNPVDFISDVSLDNTTMIKGQKTIFVSAFLWNCYIQLCKDGLNELAKSNRGAKIIKCGDEDEFVIYKRNFIWATLNVLTYLAEDKQFEKAQEILERVTSCNGFCSQSYNIDTSKSNSSNCGCNR